MTNALRCLLLVGFAALGPLPGCQGQPARSPYGYETMVKVPGRDTARAEKLNRDAAELLEKRKFDEAEQLLRRALSLDVTYGPAHNNLGKVYYHQGRYYLAAWEFQYAIQLMPGKVEPKNNLGLVFEAVGRLDEAVERYAEARALEPDNVQVLGNLARAKVQRGDAAAEVADLLRELVLKDTRPEWVQWARQRLALMGSDTPVQSDRSPQAEP